jgi:DHA2 family multidrug resistance protein
VFGVLAALLVPVVLKLQHVPAPLVARTPTAAPIGATS